MALLNRPNPFEIPPEVAARFDAGCGDCDVVTMTVWIQDATYLRHNEDVLRFDHRTLQQVEANPGVRALREAHAYQDRRAGCWVGEGGI